MTEQHTPEEMAQELAQLVAQLRAMGRNDLLLRAVSVPVLEELRLEAAKAVRWQPDSFSAFPGNGP